MATGIYVLVGYDGSQGSEDALRWAVQEARLRQLPLWILHAWHWPYPADYSDYEGLAIVRRMGENLLDRGAELARRFAPEVQVHKQLMDGPADAALMYEGHEAELIVIGAQGWGEPVTDSSTIRLPARAQCPVVIVRTTDIRFKQVVVGVDTTPASIAALAFAFEQAALRGWRLDAVHGSWEPGVALEDDPALFDDDAKLTKIATARLKRVVAPWRMKYPQVDAHLKVVPQTPGEAMTKAAENADLVVVGNRGTSGLDPQGLGATSSALLQHAPCTVAIVPADDP